MVWIFWPNLRRGGGPEKSSVPAPIEMVFGYRLWLCGIEVGGSVEVVGEGFLGGLVVFPLPTERPIGISGKC